MVIVPADVMNDAKRRAELAQSTRVAAEIGHSL
jgi:hypothetical protein